MRTVTKTWDSGAVRALRKLLGMTQREFADMLGLHTQTVAWWEQGRTRPGPATAFLLSVLEKKILRKIKGRERRQRE